MARGGVYKSDVVKARKQLLSKGKRPSVALIRETLGDTGSFATIHRFLKELEAEDPAGASLAHPVSDTIAELVSRLAGRLHEEAQEELTTAKARFDADLAERDAQLGQRKTEAEQLSSTIQRLETKLHGEQTEHASTRTQLGEAQTLIRQLEERIAGLNARLAEHEAHAQSLESKHEQARQALEHFRTAAKEQREQEQRRFEHQVQGLQVELRQAQEALTGKNHDLLQLNRENVRLTEVHGQLSKDLQQLRSDLRARDHRIGELTLIATEHELLKARWMEAVQTGERLRAEVDGLTRSLAEEREAREHAQGLAARTGEQFSTIEKLLKELGDWNKSAQNAQGSEP